MPLILLPTASSAAAAASASAAFSRPSPSLLRASHLASAFPRLKKYGRRDRQPVTASFDEEESEDEEEEYDDEDVEEAVDEDEFLQTRPKPVGFGVGKTYNTEVEERLLREMGLGGAGRKSEPAKSKSAKDGTDLSNVVVQVRIWNLPKKKNIHKDLKLAFRGFPGLINISPANSADKKTRDPLCKGFAFLKLESLEAATRFVEMYSSKAVLFGKVEKPIKCCIVDGNSSSDPPNQASSSKLGLKPKNLVAAS